MDRLRRLWQRWRRGVLAAFSLTLLGVVVWRLQTLDWSGAWQAARTLPASSLAAAAVVALLGHLNYGAFDVLARRWLGLAVPIGRMGWIGTVSYAFTLNMGSLIGGAGVRGRLLAAAGVGMADITRVVTLALLTNWLGYAAVTGWLLCSNGLLAPAAPAEPPPLADAHALQAHARLLQAWLAGPIASAAGALLLAVVVGWLLLIGGRVWPVTRLQSAGLQPPCRRLVVVQLGLGAVNWVAMAGVMACLLLPLTGGQVPFVWVLGAQVVASLAGLVVRVPGGVGVLEAVYWALLGQRVDSAALLGALLVFRALYFIAPLLLAVPGYAWLIRQPRGDVLHRDGPRADRLGTAAPLE